MNILCITPLASGISQRYTPVGEVTPMQPSIQAYMLTTLVAIETLSKPSCTHSVYVGEIELAGITRWGSTASKVVRPIQNSALSALH